jgi:hypothetical protein
LARSISVVELLSATRFEAADSRFEVSDASFEPLSAAATPTAIAATATTAPMIHGILERPSIGSGSETAGSTPDAVDAASQVPSVGTVLSGSLASDSPHRPQKLIPGGLSWP